MELAPVPNVAFSTAACFACYKAPPQVQSLKRCSGCRRIKFCSTECSNQEWPDHKSFCKALKAIRARPNATLPPLFSPSSAPSSVSADALAARRETHSAQWMLEDDLLATALKRQPNTLESRLLYREPRCGVCWDRECDVEAREGEEGEAAKGWRLCGGCRVMAWCSKVHGEEGREEHCEAKGEDGRTQCETYQLSNEIDEFHLRHALLHPPTPSKPIPPPSLWIPPRVLSSPTLLPHSWSAYLSSLEVPKVTTAEVYGVFLEGLSPALTALAALRRFLPNDADALETVTLALLDQDPSTAGAWLPAFEELGHQLPALKNVELVLLSPSTPGSTTKAQGRAPLPLCPTCTDQGRTRSLQSVPVGSPADLPPTAPTLAFALSTSLPGEDPDAVSPFWAAALAHCKQHGTPLVVACNTAEEAQEGLERCKEAGLEVVWEVERNVWAGGRPWVDGWEEDGFWRTAGFWFGVRGSP